MYCGAHAGDKGAVWFAGFWSGVLGIHAASGSGSQTIESFHSHWQASLESNIRAAPARIFASMQEIFQEDFAERYAWGSVCDYFTPSGDEAPALYNSQSLRAAGRSPAVDFWNHRERRLCGGHNYYKVHHRTQGEDKDSWEGITTFHIMRAQKLKDVMPAEAVIDKDVANNMVMLMTAQGEKLKQGMSDTGLSTTHSNKTHPLLEVRPLEIFFKFHCAVIEGHLPTTLWSNVHKKLHNDGAKTLCSCHAFSLHGNCEHVIYVKALNNVDDYATKLAEVPLVRPKGRKRKAQLSAGDTAPGTKKLRFEVSKNA